MNIPGSVQLLGVTVPVFVVEPKKGKKNKELGCAYFSTKHITLYTSVRGKQVPDTSMQHTFFHELLHQVLDSAGYKEQNADEQFVDVVSGLLHQALGPHMK